MAGNLQMKRQLYNYKIPFLCHGGDRNLSGSSFHKLAEKGFQKKVQKYVSIKA